MAMSQCRHSDYERGGVIAVEKADYHGNRQVMAAGEVTNEYVHIKGMGGGVRIKVALLTSMRAARPAMKARR